VILKLARPRLSAKTLAASSLVWRTHGSIAGSKRMRRIHWKWIVVAGFFAEATVFAVFLILLFVATVAGVPEIARPMGTLDYIDATVSVRHGVPVHAVGRKTNRGPTAHAPDGALEQNGRCAPLVMRER
jgi:hypothetical protein